MSFGHDFRPRVDGLRVFVAIIDDFGAASSLRTNLSNYSAHLIRCPVEVEALVDQELGCPVLPFPLRYLGLPLGLRKPTAAQLQYFHSGSLWSVIQEKEQFAGLCYP
jgi:hypothetical protein